MCRNFHSRSRAHSLWVASAFAALLVIGSGAALAQEEDPAEDVIDEITVVGSQIKGAKITGALAVSVISAEDIEFLGVESGDELLDLIPEMGQNFFSEMDTAGGVNAARGDVGAINMRNLGTGNTLVLMNGRRLVNMATYQTEEVGGSFVPVNSVNSNHIPVNGVQRVEVLRDGASAIYGADAVAGVLNTVLRDDYEGLSVTARFSDYDNLPRNDGALALEWGKAFNGGATHVGVFARHYRRDRVNSKDDLRWASSDFRSRMPEGSPYAADSGDDDRDEIFRNDSANSPYGRFDVLGSTPASLSANDVTDSIGEFELFPSGHPDCAGTFFDLGNGVCMREDSGSRGVRYDINGDGAGRDLLSDLERTTLYAYFTHEAEAGIEFFSDLYLYDSKTERLNDANIDLSSVPLRVGASNYYNPLGRALIDGQPNPNRLPDPTGAIYADVPDEGLNLNMDLYRFDEYPRIIDNDGRAWRVVGGVRGAMGDWDWETAVVWSEATRDEVTHNRLSNTLITQALFDPTPAAYNPFSANVNSNIEQALIDVYRNGKTTLRMWDFKFANNEIFAMPAGPVGFLFGYEYRRETYVDDRDPRLDGTIRFMRDTDGDGVLDFEGDFEGDTYPLTSDVMRSSPTPDGAGKRATQSAFVEFQVPLHRTLDLQLAARHEDFSDVGNTTVGKIAFGWKPIDQLLFRGSWSEAFRAPNLITINEQFVARSNTLNDWVCFYGEDFGSLAEDCDYGIQRQATGSKLLRSEKSENTSLGIVVTPVENLTFTFDYWTIEKDDTIGLFGEENHMLYDLVLRLQAGTADCSNPQSLGNPDVVRLPHDPTDTELVDGYLAAGLCPVGQVDYVSDRYTNLDTRKLEGYDIGIYYAFDTAIGDFALRYNGTYYEKFEQTASSQLSQAVEAAKAADPTIIYPLIGLGDLLGINGNQEERHSASASWRNDRWGASVTAYRISDFDQVLSNSDLWHIPAMTTYTATLDYNFDVSDVNTRIRLGINNITDERAPLADASYGFFQDAHRDWGRNYYIDLRMRFW